MSHRTRGDFGCTPLRTTDERRISQVECSLQGDELVLRREGREFRFRAAPGAASLYEWHAAIVEVQRSGSLVCAGAAPNSAPFADSVPATPSLLSPPSEDDRVDSMRSRLPGTSTKDLRAALQAAQSSASFPPAATAAHACPTPSASHARLTPRASRRSLPAATSRGPSAAAAREGERRAEAAAARLETIGCARVRVGRVRRDALAARACVRHGRGGGGPM